MEVHVYTDGSGANPGPGGWAAKMLWVDETDNNRIKGAKLYGEYEMNTTNNRMELVAVIEALKKVTRTDVRIVFFTDSQYVIGCAKTWYKGWIKRGWKTKAGKPIKNRDLVEALQAELGKFNPRPEFRKVPGHAGFKYNEQAHNHAYALKCKAEQETEEEEYNVSYA